MVDLDEPKPGQTPPKKWQRPGVADGADVYAHLCEQHGETDFPDTPTVHTPSGGRHLYHAHPTGPDWPDGIRLGNTAGTLGWLVDTRAWGGYVVAPPTVSDGNPYRMVTHTPVAPLPGWIADALRPAPAKPVPARAAPLNPKRPGTRVDRYVRGAVDREIGHVRDAQHPGRNHALFVAAANLGELVAGGNLTAEHATTVLLDAANVHVGVHEFTRDEAEKTIASGLKKGANRPRPVTGQAA